MAFTQETVDQAWRRSSAHCECGRSTHGHNSVRCNKQLVYASRGRDGQGAWEAHHQTAVQSGGSDALSNCQILCWDCHKKTL